MTTEPAVLPLRLTNVSYSVGRTNLLSDISLTISGGRTLVIVGPNGAGKSLLLRLCHGLLMPTSGRIDWNTMQSRGRKHAMVFQRPVLLRRSVRGNLTHALSLTSLPRAFIKPKLEEVIERFGLGTLAAKPARLLSGGEQQRLALARAWAMDPEVLFLDEPTAHLDPGSTWMVESLLGNFRAEGITLVMATHDTDQMRRIADDVMLLHRGRLIEAGPLDVFLSNPKTSVARSYLAGQLLWQDQPEQTE